MLLIAVVVVEDSVFAVAGLTAVPTGAGGISELPGVGEA